MDWKGEIAVRLLKKVGHLDLLQDEVLVNIRPVWQASVGVAVVVLATASSSRYRGQRAAVRLPQAELVWGGEGGRRAVLAMPNELAQAGSQVAAQGQGGTRANVTERHRQWKTRDSLVLLGYTEGKRRRGTGRLAGPTSDGGRTHNKGQPWKHAHGCGMTGLEHL
ncbi:hypothetical protein NDU88_003385 [Pleurodeles waltl]|uniref:Uncharacterized protein n=1 Tax=Pleurodeles waltl TaxID=8319 RepID=A0AAV7W1Z7_PLEWA|nr:hypothetical protein NDU88_003385 [Pleurodeles waltl]